MTTTMRRRVQALVLMAVLVLSLAVRLPGAPKADAFLHNLFPADVDGFPTGHFFSDENLFVTLTSDFYGGVVCIVDAEITNPAAADCISDRAWGKPRTFSGIGTMLGYPLKSAFLTPGEWRLMTVPALKKADGSPEPGTELSEVFEVEACGPCDRSWAVDEMKPWKDMAGTMKTLGQLTATAEAFDKASKLAKVANGMYTGASLGLAGILLGGMAAGGELWLDSMLPKSSEDRAKDLFKGLATRVGSMYADIKADPPRFDYDVETVPDFVAVDALVADGAMTARDVELANRYFDAMSRAAAYGDASRVANERYQGAVINGDHTAAYRQALAASTFTFKLNQQLGLVQLYEPQVAGQGWSTDPLVTVPDGQTWNDVVAEVDALRADGFTPAQRAALDAELASCTIKNADGVCLITQEMVDQAQVSWQSAEWAADLHAIDPSVTRADLMAANTAQLDNVIDLFEHFGQWMAHNAADEFKLAPATPVNQAPVSAFDATALTGVAPLTVTFTSQATDPDGDTLSLHWDIAGTRTVDDETSVTQTFTTPGSYGVSLVATDPDGEWHQAIKWITVYPDDPGPVANNPPVAQFSPQIVDQDGPITQTFTSTSFDPDGDALTQTWYFGDGTTQTGTTATKTFPAGFIMSVLLVVSDGELTGQASGEVTSRDPGIPDPGNPPVVAFTADPSSGLSPLEVHFASTSSDPDGDALTQTWYFGDGGTGTGETATHVYAVAGTYTATLIVSDGTNSRSATKTIVVDSTTPVKAAFAVGRSYDAAATANGARTLDTGVSEYPGYPVSNLTGPVNSVWYTANGVTTEQQIIVRLAGDGRDLIDRVALGARYYTGAKTFSVALSQGSDPFGTYSTVIDHETLENKDGIETFPFARQTARYLKLTVHDGYGPSYFGLTRLSVPTVGRGGGLVSMAAGNPATIVSASGNESTAQNLLRPDNQGWYDTTGAVSEHRVRVRLGGEGPQRVGTIMLRPYGAPSAAIPIEVYTSMTGDDGDWTKALDGTLAAENSAQSFSVASNPEARFVEVRFVNPTAGRFPNLYLVEMRVVTPVGLNVADGRAVGAQIVDYSKQDNGAAENAIAPDSTDATWGTTGGPADQFLTVLLHNGEVAKIDRVSLQSYDRRAKNVRIEVSTDGATFTTVARRTLLNNNVEQSISFPAVEARYVKLFVDDGYDSWYLFVNKFRVYSADQGAAAAVPFVDQSAGTAAIESWNWDFGDGTTSTEQHPEHTFPGPGTYTVALTVTDADGATDTVSNPYTVLGVPSLSLETDAEEQLDGTATTDEGTNVKLTATADGPPVVSWEWDLGYTTLATSIGTVTAKFPDQGTYTVRYRAHTADWLWTPWATKTITARNVAPTLDIGPPLTGYATYAMTPQVTTVFDPADTLTCTWDWGDGTPLQKINGCYAYFQANVPHTYVAAGVYTATLTVDDGDGGVATDTVVLSARHNPVIVHVTDATPSATDLEVTVRLLDGFDATPLVAYDFTVGADSSAPVDGTTDGDGFATLTLPGAAGANEITVEYGGSTRYESRRMTRAVRAPKADIVFMVDESASMGTYQRAVRDNLKAIVAGLADSLDFRVGTVGYARSYDAGFGHVDAPLDGDIPTIYDGIGSLHAETNSANGYDAIVVGSGYQYRNGVLASDNTIDQRPPAASCLVLVSDADVGEANYLINTSNPDVPKADYDLALQLLQERNATLFSITAADQATKDAYGMGPGLAGQTGGDNWDIAEFAKDPAGVLESLASKCVTKAKTPDLAVALDGPSAPVSPGDEVTYKVTATNAAAIDTPWVNLAVTLPADVDFLLAAGGGTFDPVTRTVTWPTFDLNAGENLTRNITARVRTYNWEAGDHALAASATVGYNGSLGAESDTDNNLATHAGTVHVPEPVGPAPTTTTTLPETTTTTLAPTTTTLAPTTTTLAPTTTTLAPTTTTTLPATTTTTTLEPTTTTFPATTTTKPDVGPMATVPEPTVPDPPSPPAPSDVVTPVAPPAVLADQRIEPDQLPSSNGVPLARTGPAIPIRSSVAVGMFLALLGAFLVRRSRRSSGGN